jgi:hypothetical protein
LAELEPQAELELLQELLAVQVLLAELELLAELRPADQVVHHMRYRKPFRLDYLFHIYHKT